MTERETGKVKFFKEDKGFGFIKRDNGKGDIFLHAKNLPEGHVPIQHEPMSYAVGSGPKGLYAMDVLPTDGRK